MKKRSIFLNFSITLSLFIFWYVLSHLIKNDILLPTPIQVAQQMKKQVVDPVFLQGLFLTLGRLFSSLVISLLMSYLLVFLSNQNRFLKHLIQHFLMVLRIVPTVVFILMSLIWLKREATVLLITSLVMIPLLYDQLMYKISEIHQKYYPSIVLMGCKPTEILKKMYLPLLLESFVNQFKSALLLGLKVIVTAEVIVSIQKGLGNDLSTAARLNIDSVTLFADFMWILIIGILISHLFNWIEKRVLENIY